MLAHEASPPPRGLFDPYQLSGLELRNRLAISPMCQYGGVDGCASDYHLVHLGRFALGGFGLVIAEATAVLPEGRSTPRDLGFWDDGQIAPLARVASFLKQQGAAAGIQLGHAGAKGGLSPPWEGSSPTAEAFPEDGTARWDTISPSGIPVWDHWPAPRAMTASDIDRVKYAFAAAARRADQAGFDFIEIHGGHGYLLSQFLSPLTNFRTDEYGGDHASRMRLPLEVVEVIRANWPEKKGLGFRVSAVDTGGEAGTTIEDTIIFARALKERGIDILGCSSGGVRAHPLTIPIGPGYQTPFAARVRREAGIATMAVGLIGDPALANRIVESGMADLVALGRGALDDPNWAWHGRDALAPDPAYEHWQDRYRWGLKDRARQLARGTTIDLC